MRRSTLFLALAGSTLAVFAWQTAPIVTFFLSNKTSPEQRPTPDSGHSIATSVLNSPSLAVPAQNPATAAGAVAMSPLAAQAAERRFDAYAHFQMGNYEGAVNQLKAALKIQPQDALTQKNLGTALLALGFFKLQKKEVAEAEAAFEESSRLGNQDASKALARLKLRQGQIESAKELLEDLSKSGTDADSLRVLIDLALSQDEVEQADDLLNRMNEMLARPEVAKENSVAELMLFVESRKKRLEQKKSFLRVQDAVSRQGIDVSYSAPELRPQAEAVARAIESVQSKLNQILGPLPSHARLRAWLVPTNDFNQITGAPPWAAAVFDGYIRIPVGRTSNGGTVPPAILERLAKHETTHAYMYAFCGDVLPSWIGEGLAQIFEGRDVSQSQAELFRTSGRKALQFIEPEMERPFTEAPAPLVGRLYARSHLLTAQLSREGGGISATWQRILSAVCVQRRALPDVMQEQFGANNVQDLWGRVFNSAEP
ncbi:MAG: hypothetical protein RIR26_2985 [Pseudomonadota bacterium]